MQNRLKSRVLWTSIISLSLFILKTYFHVEIPEADKLVDLLLLVATAAGIFNDPTNREGF